MSPASFPIASSSRSRRSGLLALARFLILGLAIALVAACGGTASGPPAAPSANPGVPSAAGPGVASPDAGPTDADPGDGTATDGGGGNAAGDRTKGSAQVQVTGGLTETVDLPFAAVLSLWASSGPGSAYLPFTDGDAVLFMTISSGQVLVQYARTSTRVGLTSGATPCTLSMATLDDTTAKGTFECKNMTLIQGEVVGSANVTGTFEGHK